MAEKIGGGCHCRFLNSPNACVPLPNHIHSNSRRNLGAPAPAPSPASPSTGREPAAAGPREAVHTNCTARKARCRHSNKK